MSTATPKAPSLTSRRRWLSPGIHSLTPRCTRACLWQADRRSWTRRGNHLCRSVNKVTQDALHNEGSSSILPYCNRSKVSWGLEGWKALVDAGLRDLKCDSGWHPRALWVELKSLNCPNGAVNRCWIRYCLKLLSSSFWTDWKRRYWRIANLNLSFH